MAQSQLVEYLGTTRAIANATIEGIVNEGDTVVLLTIRPEPTENFLSHTLSLTEAQAARLMEDLQIVFAPVCSD